MAAVFGPWVYRKSLSAEVYQILRATMVVLNKNILAKFFEVSLIVGRPGAG